MLYNKKGKRKKRIVQWRLNRKHQNNYHLLHVNKKSAIKIKSSEKIKII